MRLRPEKIESLAHQIVDMLKNDPDITVRVDDHTLTGGIRSIITKDLKREDDIEDEVKMLIEKEISKSRKMNYDYKNYNIIIKHVLDKKIN